MQGVAAARFHMGDANMNIAGKGHAKAAPFFLQCSRLVDVSYFLLAFNLNHNLEVRTHESGFKSKY
jgi:hypothetical protein